MKNETRFHCVALRNPDLNTHIFRLSRF
jgi:hypothetical protein